MEFITDRTYIYKLPKLLEMYVDEAYNAIDNMADIVLDLVMENFPIYQIVYNLLTTRIRVRTGKMLDRLLDTTKVKVDALRNITIDIPPTGRTHLSRDVIGYGTRYTPKNHERQIITKLTPKGAYYELTGDIIDSNLIIPIIQQEIENYFNRFKVNTEIVINTPSVYMIQDVSKMTPEQIRNTTHIFDYVKLSEPIESYKVIKADKEIKELPEPIGVEAKGMPFLEAIKGLNRFSARRVNGNIQILVDGVVL